MIPHLSVSSKEILQKIRHKEISFAGNMVFKIYGRLNCKSGRRMKKANRIFFSTEKEAIESGYRPCGNCMKNEYRAWKKLQLL